MGFEHPQPFSPLQFGEPRLSRGAESAIMNLVDNQGNQPSKTKRVCLLWSIPKISLLFEGNHQEHTTPMGGPTLRSQTQAGRRGVLPRPPCPTVRIVQSSNQVSGGSPVPSTPFRQFSPKTTGSQAGAIQTYLGGASMHIVAWKGEVRLIFCGDWKNNSNLLFPPQMIFPEASRNRESDTRK